MNEELRRSLNVGEYCKNKKYTDNVLSGVQYVESGHAEPVKGRVDEFHSHVDVNVVRVAHNDCDTAA